MKCALEDRLQSTQHKLSSSGGIDDEGEVIGQKIFRERVAFDTGEGG